MLNSGEGRSAVTVTEAEIPIQSTPEEIRRVRVEVESTSKPEPGPERMTFKCDADIRISEGGEHQVCKARLTVHHPRGWMGVSAEFAYEVDCRQYPTFAARAEYACLQAVKEFPSDEIISVFLLGTGEIEFSSW
jgi:hypothetical protein